MNRHTCNIQNYDSQQIIYSSSYDSTEQHGTWFVGLVVGVTRVPTLFGYGSDSSSSMPACASPLASAGVFIVFSRIGIRSSSPILRNRLICNTNAYGAVFISWRPLIRDWLQTAVQHLPGPNQWLKVISPCLLASVADFTWIQSHWTV